MSSKSIKYINSISVNPTKYGSRNNINITAIGVFDIDIIELSGFEFISLTFPNFAENRNEELVIPYTELSNRLQTSDTNSSKLLVLWLLPNGQIYNATNIGVEGEWFFIAGGMAKNTDMDLTMFRVHYKLQS